MGLCDNGQIVSKKHDARFQVRLLPDNVKALKEMRREMSKETGLGMSMNAVANLVFSRYFQSKVRQP